MYCSNCGKQLEEEDRYCSACGAAKPPVQPQPGKHHDRPLRRIREGRKLAGVCGGVARHFHMDVTLVRILWILITIFPPLPGILAYIVCWIAMPQDPPASCAARNTPGSASQTVDA